MKPPLRAIGVAVLALALMNASAGLCFCHGGPVPPGESPGSAGCCHGPDASGTLAVTAAGSCCQIESAESAATPADAIPLAKPETVAAVAVGPSAVHAFSPIAKALPGSSPPLYALRI